MQLATPNYIEAQIPKKFKLGQEISDNAALWEIYEMIGETSNPIFPQENDGLKRIRNSLRILKRSSKQHPFPYDDLPLNLVMDQIFRYLFRNQSKNVCKASIEQDSTLHFLPNF